MTSKRFEWTLTRFLQYCLQTCIWKFWQNGKFRLALNPPLSFFSGKCGGCKHRRDFFLKYCPLHPAEICNGFLASDWFFSLWNEIKLAIDATRYIAVISQSTSGNNLKQLLPLNWRISLAMYDFKMKLDNKIKRYYSHPKIYLIFRITLYSQRFIYLGQAVLKGMFIDFDEISTTIFLYWEITYWLLFKGGRIFEVIWVFVSSTWSSKITVTKEKKKERGERKKKKRKKKQWLRYWSKHKKKHLALSYERGS